MKYILHCCSCSARAIRIDNFLIAQRPFLPITFSRTKIVSALDTILLNNKVVKHSVLISKGDELYIEYTIPATTTQRQLPKKARLNNTIIDLQHVASEDAEALIGLDIIYEDDFVLVINKARGQVVHPGAGNADGTLAQLVLSRLKDCREEDYYNNRSGIVHRLDKDTTGLILIAKTAKIHDKLTKLFATRTIEKYYLAIVKGIPKNRIATVSTYIGRDAKHRKKFAVLASESRGKSASTSYRVLYSNYRYSLLLCQPHTGRTHQIRVHMQHIGTPIVGDTLYARKCKDSFAEAPLLLHAYQLAFALHIQDTIQEYAFTAPLPQDMHEVLVSLGFSKDIATLLQ